MQNIGETLTSSCELSALQGKTKGATMRASPYDMGKGLAALAKSF